MMDDKKLIPEYKKLQDEAAPDLWDRIEAELQPVSRQNTSGENQIDEIKRKRFRPQYGAAAAAVLACLVVASQLLGLPQTRSGSSGSAPTEGAASEAQTRYPEESGGVISLATGALAVPENAVTVSADAQYFSEGILSESNLLCGAEVTGVSFAYDDSGNASKVIYDITVDSVYYAEDYLAETETMQVLSPIIESEGDEAYVLYQMRVGETYLLPLKAADGSFELLYPFAPQIQQVDEQQFLFHSGYSSLINDRTMVVEGHREGSNDFYYDRMLMRSDEAFLADLISIFK